MADNKRLGRGLEALISSYPTENEGSINGAIEVDKIVPNRNQPRQEFNTEKLNDLVKSIKSVGILQPLTVRETKDQYFELVAGERRLRAAKIVGLKAVPAYILSINADVEMMEFALIENVQREDLNPIEEAEGYAILSGKYNLSHDQIAKKIGKNRSTIANSMRLLKLPPEIKKSLKMGEITSGHARSLLGLRKSINMLTLHQKIIREELSVRETERLVKRQQQEVDLKTRKQPSKNVHISKLENELISHLGTKVLIRSRKGKGKIQIDFFSDDDLQRILDIIL